MNADKDDIMWIELSRRLDRIYAVLDAADAAAAAGRDLTDEELDRLFPL